MKEKGLEKLFVSTYKALLKSCFDNYCAVWCSSVCILVHSQQKLQNNTTGVITGLNDEAKQREMSLEK